LDADLLTAEIGEWLTTRATTAQAPATKRAIAVDGKSLRGSRSNDTTCGSRCPPISIPGYTRTSVSERIEQLEGFGRRSRLDPVKFQAARPPCWMSSLSAVS
jgi:hypothetical protein